MTGTTEAFSRVQIDVLLKDAGGERPVRARADGVRRLHTLRPSRGMSRALLKLSGSLVHDYATISDDSPSPNRASRARRAATSAGIS